MKKILVLEDNVWGHHLEYMSHLFHNIPNGSECELIYVVPHTFDEVRSLMVDQENVHVTIDYMTDEDYHQYHKGNYLTASWNKCKILRKYALKHKVNECFLIMLVYYLPLLPFFIPRGCKVSGILYRIYYYSWKELNIFRKIKDILEFLVLAKSQHIRKAYLLNAATAAVYSNKIFHTSKFAYLPDPINLPKVSVQNMREVLDIPLNQCIYLHFGALTERKGTLTILKAIQKFSDEEIKKYTYIFAGRVYNDIKSEFYRLKEELVRRGANIIVYDEFCTYEHLANLINIANVILVPYSNVSSSSGIIGYASKFNIPVIGPSNGLLGKLIRKYKLGKTLHQITPDTLYKELKKGSFENNSNPKYVEINTIKNFSRTIFNDIISH